MELTDLPPHLRGTIKQQLEHNQTAVRHAEGGQGSTSFPSRPVARGRTVQRQQGRMNKTEQRYFTDILEPGMRRGAILSADFDAIKLRIGDNCFYTPDFLVQLRDGTMELHEVKGFMEDDARVKISSIAEKYPFTVYLCRYESKTGWTVVKQ